MIEAGPLKQKVYLARENPPRFAPEGDSSSSRGRSQATRAEWREPKFCFSVGTVKSRMLPHSLSEP